MGEALQRLCILYILTLLSRFKLIDMFLWETPDFLRLVHLWC